MKQFAKHNRVMFVNSIGIRFPSLTDQAFFYRLFNKIKSLTRWAKWAQTNLLILSPIIIPLYKYVSIKYINRYLLLLQLKIAMKFFHFQEPILYIVLPTAVEIMGRLHEKLTIYHCVDKFEAYNGVPDSVREMEKRLIKNADLVFYPNRKLFEERCELNPRSFHVAHAVDYHHFSLAMSEQTAISEDIQKIKSPIIGYFGAIEYFIDQELLTYLAKQEPHWSFVLIGRVNVEMNLLIKFKNVHFLGKRNYNVLPKYAKAFDVCIIPWITNHDFDFHRSPIKLREYLSTGKPIVSVSFPEVHFFKDVVYIAQDKFEFHQYLRMAIHEKDEFKRMQRLNKVRNTSWKRKAEEISSLIIDALEH
ncbi:MAG: glycosyltransferase [bacterium]